MQKRISYLFLLFFGFTFAQTSILGKYCLEYSSYHQITCLDLKDNGQFIYSDGGHLGGVKEHMGTFVVDGEYLILKYDNKNSKILSYHKSRIWRNDKDSIVVRIKAFDIRENPIPHIFISRSGDKGRKGLPPSYEGTANLKFAKKPEEEEIITGFVGYENYSFNIDLNYNYEVEVYLSEAHREIPIRDQVDSLRLKDLREDQFTTGDKAVWKRKTD